MTLDQDPRPDAMPRIAALLRPAAPRPLVPLLSLAALLLPLAACRGQPEGPGPRGLSYGDPDPNPATYAFSDTATFAIQAPGYGAMEVESAREGTAEVHFRRTYGGYHAQVRFPRFRGTFRSAARDTSHSSESDIDGPVGLEVSFGGAIVVVDTPSLGTALLEVAGPESLVRPFFLRLPGRSVGPGARWVDTVRTSEQSAGTVSTGTSRVTYTLLGDTVFAGQRLLRIRTESVTSVEMNGVSGGVEIEQRLEGTLQGRVLWDDRANVLVDRWEVGELSGTLGMPGAGVSPMPVSATLRRRVTLRP